MVNILNRSKGTTLIELMIAMLLSFIVVGAALQLFITGKQLFYHQQGLAVLQENGRMANLILGEIMRSSGRLGCNGFNEQVSLQVHSPIDKEIYGLDLKQRIRGISMPLMKKHPLFASRMGKRLQKNSDGIWVKSVTDSSHLVFDIHNDAPNMTIHGQRNWYSGDIIVLADCTQADMMVINQDAVPLHGINQTHLHRRPSAKPSNKVYNHNSQVGLLSSTFYYVADTLRKNAHQHPIYALYSTDLNGRTLELIEGVEHLTLQYGIKENNLMHYVTSEEVTSWENVVSIKMTLLLTSIEDSLPRPQNYFINEQKTLPTDRLMRKWWAYEWLIKGLSE